MRRLSLSLLLASILHAQTFTRDYGRSMTITRHGIAATSQILASQAGAEMLARGGSAADAAIAANAVLGLVEPMMDGIGGDLFSLYWDAKSGQLYGLNASGWTPKKITIEYMTAKGLKSMPGSGIDSATVPGCVAGWAAIHKRFGKLSWQTLFEPAIHYATEGFPVTERIAAAWGGETNLKRLRLPEGAPEIFLPGGKAPAQGELFRNPALAKALTLIAEQGAAAFYRGGIARAILAAERQLGGAMEAEDLAEWEPEWVEPISTTYRGWRVYELPPNSQGIGALEMLNLMETAASLPDWAPMSPEAWHWKIESMRIAYTDLRRNVSDPRFVKVPVDQMLSKEYARRRAAGINPDRANCKTGPGDIGITGNTTYLATVDSEGNIASWIQSVAGLWGSAVAVPGFGFHLHNRGGGFKLDPRHANALLPRKRPFHTIIPGFAEKDGKRLGFGIMGGPVQPLSHAQFISNMVDHGMNLQGALEAPRFVEARANGRKLEGCEVGMETRVPVETRQALERLGHKIDPMGAYNVMFTGTGQAVMHDSSTHVNYAASDPRGDGAAVPESPRGKKK